MTEMEQEQDIAPGVIAVPAYDDRDVRAMRWQVQDQRGEADRAVETLFALDLGATLHTMPASALGTRLRGLRVSNLGGTSFDVTLGDETYNLRVDRRDPRPESVDDEARRRLEQGERAHERHYRYL